MKSQLGYYTVILYAQMHITIKTLLEVHRHQCLLRSVFVGPQVLYPVIQDGRPYQQTLTDDCQLAHWVANDSNIVMYQLTESSNSDTFETVTRNSAIADKPRDAFRGQSRSPNMVPFHTL